MIRIAIIGATGFSGQELVKIAEEHPELDIAYRTGRDWQQAGFDIDLAFLALPHGTAKNIVPHFLKKGIKVIDLSADFRYKSPDLLKELQSRVPDFQELNWIYSLPELDRDKVSQTTRLIANPGCYPTASILALAPLFRDLKSSKRPLFSDHEGGNPHVIIDAKSGYSGAGKSFAESTQVELLRDNMWAYKLAGAHNHNREIECQLGGVAVSFSPHILPLYRGILATIYVDLPANSSFSSEDLYELYQDFYREEPFINIQQEMPSLRDVQFSNKCALALRLDQRLNRLIIISVIDNLQKGAAGQAIQNANILFDWPETMGLETNG